ncbi:MAG: RagB/SusD family nutrient uptake outer membrane protein [Prevotellaceae bacterium]|jgi:hypothetical protein|nr:RagB/SusD family nutrient uptake outer membrane protein [Prevotellaceae bacterium]
MKKILTIILISFVLTSCSEEWLNLNPYDSVSDELAIQTVADAQTALNGVYMLARTADFYGRNTIVCGDAGTPDVVLKEPNAGRFVPEYNWQNVFPGAGFFTTIYTRGYRTIDAVNRLIKKLGEIPISDNEKDKASQILGEAYFIRALIHFEILKFYSHAYNYTTDGSHLGVVYMFEPTEENDHPRVTAKESFGFVITDAEQALASMKIDAPEKPFSAGKMAVNAFLARVYLYRACKSGTDDLLKAKEYAEKVITLGNYRIATKEEYKFIETSSGYDSQMWQSSEGYSSESILVFPFNSTETLGTTSIGSIYLDPGKGYGDLFPSNELVAFMDSESADVRNSIFYDYSDGKTYLRKFSGPPAISLPMNNVNLFRVSEMYLVASEAAARIGGNDNETQAKEYLNLIRINRGLSSIDVSGQYLIDEIMLERRKELCFEGHRLADHKRLNMNIVRGHDSNNPGNSIYGINYPDYRFAYPIPRHEIDINKAILQNPGY